MCSALLKCHIFGKTYGIHNPTSTRFKNSHDFAIITFFMLTLNKRFDKKGTHILFSLTCIHPIFVSSLAIRIKGKWTVLV